MLTLSISFSVFPVLECAIAHFLAIGQRVWWRSDSNAFEKRERKKACLSPLFIGTLYCSLLPTLVYFSLPLSLSLSLWFNALTRGKKKT